MTEPQTQSCIDPDLGWRIHEYELGTLDSETMGKFEEHLIACEHCRHQIEVTMSAMMELAGHREEIRELLRNSAKAASPTSFSLFFRRAFQSVYVRYVAPAIAVAAVTGIFVMRNPSPTHPALNSPHLIDRLAVPQESKSEIAGQVRPDSLAGTKPLDSRARTEPRRATDIAIPGMKQDLAADAAPPASLPAVRDEIATTQGGALRSAGESELMMESAPMAKAAAAPSGQIYRRLITRDAFPWSLPISSPSAPSAPPMGLAFTGKADTREASPPADTAALRLATESYSGKVYGVAANYFEIAAQSNSFNLEYKLMSGVSSYLSHQYWKAIPMLVYADSAATDARLKSRARWYLANTALAMNDPLRADTLLQSLIDSGSEYKDQAAQLRSAIQQVAPTSR